MTSVTLNQITFNIAMLEEKEFGKLNYLLMLF